MILNDRQPISRPELFGNTVPKQLHRGLPCRSCGYDLSGQAEDGRCPECGTPVAMSRRSDRLCFSNPDWLAKLVRGTTWLIVSLLGYLVGGCLGGVLFPGRFYYNTMPFAISITALIGIWLFTTPESTEAAAKSFLNVRVLARTGQVAVLTIALVRVILGGSGIPPLILLVVLGLAGILALIGLLALLVSAQRLAARLPRGNLDTQTKIILWGWSILLGLSVLGLVLVLVMRFIFSSATPSLLPGVTAIGVFWVGASFLIFFILVVWTLILLFCFQSQLGEELRAARKIWQAGSPEAGAAAVN